jgi:hypothetical protein
LAPTHVVPSMSLHPLTGDWYATELFPLLWQLQDILRINVWEPSSS